MSPSLLRTSSIVILAAAGLWLTGCFSNPASRRIPRGPPASAIQVSGDDESSDAGTDESPDGGSDNRGDAESDESADTATSAPVDRNSEPVHEKPEEIEP